MYTIFNIQILDDLNLVLCFFRKLHNYMALGQLGLNKKYDFTISMSEIHANLVGLGDESEAWNSEVGQGAADRCVKISSPKKGEEISNMCFKMQQEAKMTWGLKVWMTEIWMFFFVNGTDLGVKWIWEDLQCDFILCTHRCECVGDKIILF